MSASTGAANLYNNGATARAGFALLAEDLEVRGEVTSVAVSVSKILEGGAANGNTFTHDVT